MLSILILIHSIGIEADGFLLFDAPSSHPSINTGSSKLHLSSTKEEEGHRWKHDPFDFSSKIGWDDFYKQGMEDDSADDTSVESLEYEWHPHIPHSVIVDCIRPAISAASQSYIQQSTTQNQIMPSILLVGTGNSALPRILHDAFDIDVEVTCLDYSPICIEMIRSMYQASCPNMKFVVGDATRLHEVQWSSDTASQLATNGKKQFDIIIDKGLLDALMCGDGFDIESLMNGANHILTSNEWGMHILICFELSKSSKQSLVDLGNNENDPGLVWDFNIPVEGSENGRGCFNVAWRSKEKKDNNILGIEEKLITEWI